MKTTIKILSTLSILSLLLFSCTQESNTCKFDKNNLVAKKMIHVVELEKDESRPSWTKGLDKEDIVNKIMDKVDRGDIIVFENHYSEKPMPIKDLQNYIGERNDTIYDIDLETGQDTSYIYTTPALDRDDITHLLFIENWYMSNDLTINKEVTGIGLIKTYYKLDPETQEEVSKQDLLFVTYFNEAAIPTED